MCCIAVSFIVQPTFVCWFFVSFLSVMRSILHHKPWECTCVWLNSSQVRVELLYNLRPVFKWTLCHMALPFSETKLPHGHKRVGTVALHSGHLNVCPLVSHPVVVDQLVGLHFVLCLDGWFAVRLHAAVITSVVAWSLQDKSTKQIETNRVYKNTFAILLPTTHICGQICILLQTWKVILSVEKLEWV